METPTFANDLGAKGVGESGTIGSIPAVYNAVVDALAHLGVRHLETPATPERIWRALRAPPVHLRVPDTSAIRRRLRSPAGRPHGGGSAARGVTTCRRPRRPPPAPA